MFEQDSLIVYAGSGVCRVGSVGKLARPVPGQDKDRLYYTLAPVYGGGVVYVPEESDAVNDGTEDAAPEIDQNGDTVYDTEDDPVNDTELSPTPTPDPRDAWFDSMYNQNRN